MNGKGGFVVKFASPFDESAVIIEDDGRVAYAYMLGGDGQICSDVWLYNRCPTPVEPEWHDPANLPFANPAPFANEGSPGSACDFFVEWNDAEGVLVAKILLRDDYFARLEAGAKPGWSSLAAKDGPLAQVLR
ncbi:hypothetical protein E4K66_22665 [Bradyrhizobium frederickii]|uniref:Uncharacterized protein n=1 Tax=Bradyrhizobium frederickii TaxID=2560054 RepID=A0A4Y9L1Y7_9BRAD|nr:hypothetical protein [Bradyrhizobium frederickii]TFV36809.1 hypothetical protein E4K66_22665 [Bradyrhizobium frederickii]